MTGEYTLADALDSLSDDFEVESTSAEDAAPGPRQRRLGVESVRLATAADRADGMNRSPRESRRATTSQFEGWMDRAACKGEDPEIFFPSQGQSAELAKQICASCEVRKECLDFAEASNARDGIWAGLSSHERARLRR